MMTIGSAHGTGNSMQAGGPNMQMQTDPVSRSIQNQIANAQKQLQELSSNEEMTQEDKMKRRQEIQQEIAALNQQLRKHQTEQRKEQQAEKAVENADGNRAPGKDGRDEVILSQEGMQAMLSADASMKQAKVQGRMAVQMDGKAGVLEAEIKLDSSRGMSAERKEEELADTQQKAQEALNAQISALSEAGRTMKDAAEVDAKRTDKSAPGGEAVSKSETMPEDEDTSEKDEMSVRTDGTEEHVPASGGAPQISIDVRL